MTKRERGTSQPAPVEDSSAAKKPVVAAAAAVFVEKPRSAVRVKTTAAPPATGTGTLSNQRLPDFKAKATALAESELRSLQIRASKDAANEQERHRRP